jgi:phenylacetate-CoA ligase
VGDDGCSDILVTSLYHRTMPLIRYRLGDRIKLRKDPCACGDPLPAIETVVGRSDDFVTLPSGRKVSARAINLLEGVEGILEYQIVQQERDLFVVSVVPIGVLDAPKEEEIERIIQRGCGDEPIRVEVRSTSGIGRSRTGKLRAVVSNVS